MKEMWISYYTQYGEQSGATVQAGSIDEAENILKSTVEDFGGIADYGFYEED